jgi:hypothetical protein
VRLAAVARATGTISEIGATEVSCISVVFMISTSFAAAKVKTSSVPLVPETYNKHHIMPTASNLFTPFCTLDNLAHEFVRPAPTKITNPACFPNCYSMWSGFETAEVAGEREAVSRPDLSPWTRPLPQTSGKSIVVSDVKVRRPCCHAGHESLGEEVIPTARCTTPKVQHGLECGLLTCTLVGSVKFIGWSSSDTWHGWNFEA